MVTKLPPSKYDPFMEMRKPDYEIKYVLDETPPEVALHAHIFYELYLFCEGDLEAYVVDNNSYRLKPGDIVIIPPEVKHHPIFSGANSSYKRYLLYLSQNFLEKLSQIDPELCNVLNQCKEKRNYLIRCKNPARSSMLEDRLISLWDASAQTESCSKALRVCQCIEFLVDLNRASTERLLVHSKIGSHRPLLEQIIAYISENYHKQISLNETASTFFVSPSTVENLFKQRLGKSFYRYVIEYRIISAQSLIVKGTPLKDVSNLCGFTDYSTFFKMFRKEVGVSPTEFRILSASAIGEYD